jgi:hypothetical protein
VAGEPIGLRARVLAEVIREAGLPIDDFDVCADLVLHPPTPSPTRTLDPASACHRAAQLVAAEAVRNGAPQDQISACHEQIKMATARRRQRRKPR